MTTNVVVSSGFLAVVASVRASFAAQGNTAVVEVGWKRRWRQDNQGAGGASRVVFTPSEDNGAGGNILPPKFPGDRQLRDGSNNVVGHVRALADEEHTSIVSIWAVDNTDRENEELQIAAVETLKEQTMNAIYESQGAFASVTWGAKTWTPPPERAFGLELRFGMTLRTPIFMPPTLRIFPTGFVVNRGEPWTDPAAVNPGDT